jgi:hypothetical protein
VPYGFSALDGEGAAGRLQAALDAFQEGRRHAVEDAAHTLRAAGEADRKLWSANQRLAQATKADQAAAWELQQCPQRASGGALFGKAVQGLEKQGAVAGKASTRPVDWLAAEQQPKGHPQQRQPEQAQWQQGVRSGKQSKFRR